MCDKAQAKENASWFNKQQAMGQCSLPQAVRNKEIDDSIDRIVAGMEGKPLVDGKAK